MHQAVIRPASFIWHVSEAGYEWDKEGIDENDWRLVPIERSRPAKKRSIYVHDSVRYRLTHPLTDSPCLFREFAKMEPTAEAVLGFANRYGCLGDYLVDHSRDVDQISTDEELYYHGITRAEHDLLQDWRWAILRMRPCIEVYEAYQNRKPGINGMVRIEDVIGILNAANAYLQRRATLKVSLRDFPPHEPAKPILEVQPINLLGALWLQFVQMVIGSKEGRFCSVCSEYFVVSPSDGRSDKEFCSTKCRMKAYRDRVRQARQLQAEGKDIADIAESLGSAPSIVRGWLSKSTTENR